MTTVPGSTPITTPTFGHVGYDAYGNHPSVHGPWTTFDGRPMPKWEEYSAAGPGSSGGFTQDRWEEAAKAIIAEHERRKGDDSGDKPARTFEKVAVVLSPATQQLQVVGVWTAPSGQRQWVVLCSDTITGAAAGDLLDIYECWKAWAPRGRAVVVLETATGGALLEPLMGELQKEDPTMPIVLVRGCWWCGAGLECPTGCQRQSLKAPDKTMTIKVDATELNARLDAFKAEVEEVVNGPDGRTDPFLMGLSEIASATRDLAEAAVAAEGLNTSHPVEGLIKDVTEALHTRVQALASPPAEPDATA